MATTTGVSPQPGLCATCRNVRILDTRGNSRFYLCKLWAVNAAFAKYPNIPVLRCKGYTRKDPLGDERDRE
jgi:hypothetical protein